MHRMLSSLLICSLLHTMSIYAAAPITDIEARVQALEKRAKHEKRCRYLAAGTLCVGLLAGTAVVLYFYFSGKLLPQPDSKEPTTSPSQAPTHLRPTLSPVFIFTNPPTDDNDTEPTDPNAEPLASMVVVLGDPDTGDKNWLDNFMRVLSKPSRSSGEIKALIDRYYDAAPNAGPHYENEGWHTANALMKVPANLFNGLIYQHPDAVVDAYNLEVLYRSAPLYLRKYGFAYDSSKHGLELMLHEAVKHLSPFTMLKMKGGDFIADPQVSALLMRVVQSYAKNAELTAIVLFSGAGRHDAMALKKFISWFRKTFPVPFILMQTSDESDVAWATSQREIAEELQNVTLVKTYQYSNADKINSGAYCLLAHQVWDAINYYRQLKNI